MDASSSGNDRLHHDRSLRFRDRSSIAWPGEHLRRAQRAAGIETLVPVVISEARRRGFTWRSIVSLLAGNPARLWGLAPQNGTIQPGADADLAIIDPVKHWTILGKDLHHLHKWTPFEGMEVQGKVVRTLVRGCTVFASEDDDRAPPGTGRFIAAGRSAAPASLAPR